MQNLVILVAVVSLIIPVNFSQNHWVILQILKIVYDGVFLLPHTVVRRSLCFRTVTQLVLQRLILATIVITVISYVLVTSQNHLLHQQLLTTLWFVHLLRRVDCKSVVFLCCSLFNFFQVCLWKFLSRNISQGKKWYILAREYDTWHTCVMKLAVNVRIWFSLAILKRSGSVLLMHLLRKV